ncbi:Hpt domain-containing protein [Noviherbaspirillum aridicola]|uniref:HPt domain-containing protein n=1 Tax=Noviherbaspirillum aridicola TaxID=2849687 RepID=A0ABQ4Q6H9_9BURK|nr:Hpt domain-containing protein [Noviherbaspirillum aridicola]GIZ52324.1 hypothetical protein NCCP691_23380 [Noviherbaspirillum aridicola]
MSDAGRRLEEALQKVAAAFDARLPERLRQLESLWHAYEDGGADSAEALRRELHRLRGTASSYGYRALSQQLREAEDQLREVARPALRASMRQVFDRRWERDAPLT